MTVTVQPAGGDRVLPVRDGRGAAARESAAVRRDLVRLAEPVGAAWRALMVVLDPVGVILRPGALWLLAPLAVVHLALPAVYARYGGPWTRGGRWVLLDLAHAAGLMALGIAVTAPGQLPVTGFPFAAYQSAAVPTLALAVLYEWRRPWLARRPALGSVLLWFAVIPFVVVAVGRAGGPWTPWRAWMAVFDWLWAAIGLLLALGLVLLVRLVTQRQLEVRQQALEESFAFLQSEMTGPLAALRVTYAADPPTQADLDEIEARMADYRTRLQLRHDRVDLDALLRERVGSVRTVLQVAPVPAVGPLRLAQDDAVVADRVLADLLDNSHRAGARVVTVQAAVADRVLTLTVTDDGPGFTAPELAAGSSLWRWRTRARQRGGDLVVGPGRDGGACVQLRWPLGR